MTFSSNYNCDSDRAELFDVFRRLRSFVIKSIFALFDNPAMTSVLWRDDDNEDNLLYALEQILDARLFVTHVQIRANVANFFKDLRKF